MSSSSLTITPSLDALRGIIAQRGAEGNCVPLSADVVADLETPVSAFLKLRRGRYSFLLESVEGGEQIARFSFIGTNPYAVLVSDGSQGDPLVAVEAEAAKLRPIKLSGMPPFTGGAVGYLSYDACYHFEPTLPVLTDHPTGVPESVWMMCRSVVAFDHVKHSLKLISLCSTEGDLERNYTTCVREIEELYASLSCSLAPTPRDNHDGAVRVGVSNLGEDGYKAAVAHMKKHIFAGDIIQAVPSQRIARPTAVHPFNIYRQLRVINPSPYMFFLDLDSFQIVGASPELLVKVEHGVVTTHPIAGTRPRGATAAEDVALEKELLADEKEIAEHVMLVDLARNDIGRIAQPGSVAVSDLMHIERFSHVMHIVSQVSGTLRPSLSAFDALRAVFPAGTLSGAPKIRAMQLIAECERQKRGVYGGAVGYFSFDGVLDTCIAIRTLLCKNGVAFLQAGAGIVFDSDAQSEYNETMTKMKATLRAIERAEQTPQPGKKRGRDDPPDNDPRHFW